jgi:hypothetical protein
MELLKALPGNGFINTFQHTAMGAMFSVNKCYGSLLGSSQLAHVKSHPTTIEESVFSM